jgi:hypothetical protein
MAIKYTFGRYNETPEGKKFEKLGGGKFDSDAQAEMNARRFSESRSGASIYIRRADAEWSVRA